MSNTPEYEVVARWAPSLFAFRRGQCLPERKVANILFAINSREYGASLDWDKTVDAVVELTGARRDVDRRGYPVLRGIEFADQQVRAIAFDMSLSPKEATKAAANYAVDAGA